MELNKNGCKYSIRIRIHKGRRGFGPGVAQLLKGVKDTGSLSRAASVMSMSYTKAWNSIHNVEDEFGFALLTRKIGGESGGGSNLTAEGEELLNKFEKMEKVAADAIDKMLALEK